MDAGKRALESPPQPAAKRRINPVPAAPTNGAHGTSESAPAGASESRAPDNAARTGGGKKPGTATADPPQAGGGESDRSDDEDEEEESRQARLYGLGEEEVEELIWGEEGLLAARDEADRCAAMLEGGASDRLPGEVRQRRTRPALLPACVPVGSALALPPRAQADCHVKMLPERLEAEAEFMSELREQGLTGDELREEAMGTRAEYEELLAEQHEVTGPTHAATALDWPDTCCYSPLAASTAP